MWFTTEGRRIFLWRGATDMRKSFHGLSGIVVSRMGGKLLSGDIFVFINRRRDRMKILCWDRTGFVIWYKRLPRSGPFGRGRNLRTGRRGRGKGGVEPGATGPDPGGDRAEFGKAAKTLQPEPLIHDFCG